MKPYLQHFIINYILLISGLYSIDSDSYQRKLLQIVSNRTLKKDNQNLLYSYTICGGIRYIPLPPSLGNQSRVHDLYV